ncbi:hypothetical protein QR680_010312 [Steinernema hermaphroditum]|uniref:Uncharacterized protein n=1 Tax=Steinernema hermaphroditum TaxID=289476 RepID=A0AA39IPR9_9BILA|nr:hypothetical protein QR680_010312 [Steinernema hermaphroditum]
MDCVVVCNIFGDLFFEQSTRLSTCRVFTSSPPLGCKANTLSSLVPSPLVSEPLFSTPSVGVFEGRRRDSARKDKADMRSGLMWTNGDHMERARLFCNENQQNF